MDRQCCYYVAAKSSSSSEARCPSERLDVVRHIWQRLTEQLSDSQKLAVFNAFIANVAGQDEDLANVLRANYLPVTAVDDSQAAAAAQFFEDWHIQLISYPDLARLTAYLQDQVNIRTTWARAFLGNAQLVARAATA